MGVLAIFFTIIGLAAWMGAAIFLTFFVTPVVQRKLNPGKMADLMDNIGARYYGVGIGSSILMLLGSGTTLFIERLRVPALVFTSLTVLALLVTLYIWLVIVPRTVSLRERLQSSAGTEENFRVRERFDQATRLTAFLTFVVLIILVGAAAALAAILAIDGTPPTDAPLTPINGR